MTTKAKRRYNAVSRDQNKIERAFDRALRSKKITTNTIVQRIFNSSTAGARYAYEAHTCIRAGKNTSFNSKRCVFGEGLTPTSAMRDSFVKLASKIK